MTTLRTLKSSLGLPLRFGWNGDPCVPQQHPWSGVECQFDATKMNWVIDGLYVLYLILLYITRICTYNQHAQCPVLDSVVNFV